MEEEEKRKLNKKFTHTHKKPQNTTMISDDLTN